MKFLWQQIPSTTISELLCYNDEFDGIVLDTEHGIFSNETLFNCIQVITLYGKECFVRLTELNKTLIRYCLDAGVTGLIFSTVEDIRYAKEIFDICRYPIDSGRRGLGLVRCNNWGQDDNLQNLSPFIIAQIETKKAVDNLEVISNFKFDYFMIGPYDLSASIGCVGNFEDEKFKSSLNKIKKNIPNEKLGYHIVKNVKEQYKKLKGCGFIAMSMDSLMILDSMKLLEKI